MTTELRDQIAIAALQGMLASGHQESIEQVWIATGESPTKGLALAAYGFADAMMSVRDGAEKPSAVARPAMQSSAPVSDKKRKPVVRKHPVITINNIPPEHFRQSESSHDENSRCKAATRPWLGGLGQRDVFTQCCNGVAPGDGLCAFHRRIADEVGVVKWQQISKK